SDFPLASLEPQFAELSDSMADLEANFMHLQLLNESIARFNEDFGGFLYGMNMSAFCIDFPEAPIPQSFARHKDSSAPASSQNFPESPFQPRTSAHGGDADATFLTTDTSFVENPPTSSKPASKYSAPPSGAGGASERRSTVAGRARGRAGGAAATRVGTMTGIAMRHVAKEFKTCAKAQGATESPKSANDRIEGAVQGPDNTFETQQNVGALRTCIG
ncbi:hypothetical protein KC315_g17323, partial [Hortaea werneckii]